MTKCCSVLELRQYTLHPGTRDVLVDVFERHFVEGQEDVGMHIVGTFEDREAPDHFVWVRGFDDMATRRHALETFYGGPVWRAHSDTANATMIDSDDVLLLRPLRLSGGFPPLALSRPAVGADAASPAVMETTIHYRRPDVPSEAGAESRAVDQAVRVLEANGAEVIAVLTTLKAFNDFPVLPVRDADVLVWITRFADDDALRRCGDALADSREWADVQSRLAAVTYGQPQKLRLRPTPRSQLR